MKKSAAVLGSDKSEHVFVQCCQLGLCQINIVGLISGKD